MDDTRIVRFVGGPSHNDHNDVWLSETIILVVKQITLGCKELLWELEERQIELVIDRPNNKLRFNTPDGMPEPELLKRMSEHKAELLECCCTYRLTWIESCDGCKYCEYHLAPPDETRDIANPNLALDNHEPTPLPT